MNKTKTKTKKQTTNKKCCRYAWLSLHTDIFCIFYVIWQLLSNKFLLPLLMFKNFFIKVGSSVGGASILSMFPRHCLPELMLFIMLPIIFHDWKGLRWLYESSNTHHFQPLKKKNMIKYSKTLFAIPIY